MKKTSKIATALIALIVIALSVLPVAAAQPSVLPIGEPSSFNFRLNRESQKKLIAAAIAETSLSVIRVYPSTANQYPILMAIWEDHSTGSYQYFAAFTNNTQVFSTSESSTTLTLYPSTAITVYGWSDMSNGGWQYCSGYSFDNVNALVATVSTSQILYRVNLVNNNRVVYDHSDDTTAGSALIGTVAQSWIDAYDVKVNGLSTTSGYTQAEYEAYGQTKYTDGIRAGRLEVTSSPSDFNLFTATQYSQNYTAGQNSVINNPNRYNLYTQSQYNEALQGSGTGPNTPAVLDLESVLLAIPSAAKDMIVGAIPEEPTVFGISFLGLAAAILITVFTIWIVKKVK